jgi:hypothetical protein
MLTHRRQRSRKIIHDSYMTYLGYFILTLMFTVFYNFPLRIIYSWYFVYIKYRYLHIVSRLFFFNGLLFATPDQAIKKYPNQWRPKHTSMAQRKKSYLYVSIEIVEVNYMHVQISCL